MKIEGKVVSLGVVTGIEEDRTFAGDIIDGYHPKDQSMAALDAITASFDELGKPHWHMIGNHCLYNLPREVRRPHTVTGLVSASCYCCKSHACFPLNILISSTASCYGCTFLHVLVHAGGIIGVLEKCGMCRC